MRYSCVFGASCEHSSPASGSLSFHLHKIFNFRTVYTFVGGPEAIIEGALAAAKAAFPLIDMTKHKGKQYWLKPVLRTPQELSMIPMVSQMLSMQFSTF